MTEKEWEDKSLAIFKKVAAHPFFLRADSVYCYVDYRREVGTRNLIEECWRVGKRVAVPKVEGNKMQFYYIQHFSDLTEGYRGISEPQKGALACEKNALVIMPGAAFDHMRNRIGYGKGFYDRFLHIHPDFHTIALAFSCQMVDEIIADAYDVRPEILITEEQTYDESITG